MATEKLLKAIRQAQDEMLGAMTRFQEVTDPDLVDATIHEIDAAERRFIHLLKQAKAEKLHLAG